jgi:hypothetical protein
MLIVKETRVSNKVKPLQIEHQDQSMLTKLQVIIDLYW